jgi:MFS family permease
VKALHGLSADLGRLIAAQVCLHSCMAGARMAAPLLTLSLGHGKVAAGLVVASFALAQFFLVLPAGRFADRNALMRPLRWCIVAASTGAGLAALWPVYPVLFIAASLCGGAFAAGTIAIQRHVGRAAASSSQRRQVFSWLAVAPAAANFVGPLVAGLMIDLAGFRAAFLVLAAMPVLAWLLARSVHQGPEDTRVVRDAGTAWELLRDAVLRRLLVMNWFVTATWELHAFMVPVLGHDRGLPATAIGSILGAYAIGMFAIRLAMPLFGAGVREWVLIAAANAATGALLLVYPFTPSPLAMGLCSAALGMSAGGVQPMITSLLHQITPDHRHGEAIALRLMSVNASSVAMPMLLGAAGGLIGVSAVFWTMGVIVGMGSPLAMRLRGVGLDNAEH